MSNLTAVTSVQITLCFLELSPWSLWKIAKIWCMSSQCLLEKITISSEPAIWASLETWREPKNWNYGGGQRKRHKKAHYNSLFLPNFLLHHKTKMVTLAALFPKKNNQFRMPETALVYSKAKMKTRLEPKYLFIQNLQDQGEHLADLHHGLLCILFKVQSYSSSSDCVGGTKVDPWDNSLKWVKK